MSNQVCLTLNNFKYKVNTLNDYQEEDIKKIYELLVDFLGLITIEDSSDLDEIIKLYKNIIDNPTKTIRIKEKTI